MPELPQPPPGCEGPRRLRERPPPARLRGGGHDRCHQDGLNAGAAHKVLYTDLSNITANSVYQAIGYVADHDAQEVRFD